MNKTKIRNRLLSIPLLRKASFLVFNSPFIVSNPAYKHLYQRKINCVIEAFSDKPQLVIIEVTNSCNLCCPHCPNKSMQRKKGLMKLSVYKKIINECVALGVDEVCITGGEPTLHPSLLTQIAYAKIRGIKSLTLITNAQLLTPFLSMKLIEADLDKLDVSIDATTPETYSKMRPPGDLETAEENLEVLLSLKRSMEASKPQVTVKFIKEPINKKETKSFKRKWQNLADEVFISFLHNWGGSIDKKEPKWKGDPKRTPCSKVFREMYVCFDGRVCICCLDSEVTILEGNVKKSTIKEIWHSARLQEIRQAHLKGVFGGLPLCDKCSFRDVWWLY